MEPATAPPTAACLAYITSTETDGGYFRQGEDRKLFYTIGDHAGAPLTVFSSVRIDRGSLWSNHAHDPRLLGTARDPADAVARWGVLRWREQCLSVGGEGALLVHFRGASWETTAEGRAVAHKR